MYEWIESTFHIVVRYCIFLLELTGTVIIMRGAILAVIDLLRGRRESVRLRLAENIALALEFKLGGEILHTVVLRETSELILIGAIVLMRIAMTVLIHWEINIEKAEDHEKRKEGSGGKKD